MSDWTKFDHEPHLSSVIATSCTSLSAASTFRGYLQGRILQHSPVQSIPILNNHPHEKLHSVQLNFLWCSMRLFPCLTCHQRKETEESSSMFSAGWLVAPKRSGMGAASLGMLQAWEDVEMLGSALHHTSQHFPRSYRVYLCCRAVTMSSVFIPQIADRIRNQSSLPLSHLHHFTSTLFFLFYFSVVFLLPLLPSSLYYMSASKLFKDYIVFSKKT